MRGNKIAPLWHTCLASLGTRAKGVQFYCPSRTYPAIPYCTIFPFLEHCVSEKKCKPFRIGISNRFFFEEEAFKMGEKLFILTKMFSPKKRTDKIFVFFNRVHKYVGLLLLTSFTKHITIYTLYTKYSTVGQNN